MNDIIKPEAGMVATQGFGENMLAVSGETMATVLAAREKAKVEWQGQMTVKLLESFRAFGRIEG